MLKPHQNHQNAYPVYFTRDSRNLFDDKTSEYWRLEDR